MASEADVAADVFAVAQTVDGPISLRLTFDQAEGLVEMLTWLAGDDDDDE